MDMGAVKNFKGHYCACLNEHIIASLDADPHRQVVNVARKTALSDTLHLAKECHGSLFSHRLFQTASERWSMSSVENDTLVWALMC